MQEGPITYRLEGKTWLSLKRNSFRMKAHFGMRICCDIELQIVFDCSKVSNPYYCVKDQNH